MKKIIDYIIAIYLWLFGLIAIGIFTFIYYAYKDTPGKRYHFMMLIFSLPPTIIQSIIGYYILKGKNLAKILALVLLLFHEFLLFGSQLKYIPIGILILVIFSFFLNEEE